jgi:hypothetical protein
VSRVPIDPDPCEQRCQYAVDVGAPEGASCTSQTCAYMDPNAPWASDTEPDTPAYEAAV